METFLLLCINHQSSIATKANRIVRAAKGRPVMDAAYAHAHNEQLFSGMLSWGPIMALALIGLAVVWTKFLRH